MTAADRPPSPQVPEGTGNIAPWSESWQPEPAQGEAFEELMVQLRRVLAISHGSRPSTEVASEVAGHLARVADLLEGHPADEAHQLAAKQIHRPGRSQALVPAVHTVDADDEHFVGRVTFGRFHLGGGGAAHGGTLPLVFDEVLGRLAGGGGRPRSRTAFLRVDYRNVTPLDRELTVEGTLAGVDGRKIWTRGRLLDGATVCAEAEGLFVVLRPGQP